jgi:hypothetical protein
LCWVEVHCGIDKSSYNVLNVSYLNSPPHTPLLYSSLPPFLEWFQQVSFLHLHACVHTFCTIFTLLLLFPTTSLLPLVPVSPWERPVPPSFIVVSAGLRILYSFLYRENISYIHLLNFLLLPYPSHMCPPLNVTSFS